MLPTRMNRLQHLLLVIFLPLTAVAWLFQLNPAASSASATATLDVVVSEIAWMGTTGNTNDEWLELANNTAGDIDLIGWRLVASDGTPDIALTGIIPAGGRYLLERTDDTTTPQLADQIYTGSLLNSGEVLTLTDSLDTVIDVAGAPGAWFAGVSATKETMLRTALTASGHCLPVGAMALSMAHLPTRLRMGISIPSATRPISIGQQALVQATKHLPKIATTTTTPFILVRRNCWM